MPTQPLPTPRRLDESPQQRSAVCLSSFKPVPPVEETLDLCEDSVESEDHCRAAAPSSAKPTPSTTPAVTASRARSESCHGTHMQRDNDSAQQDSPSPGHAVPSQTKAQAKAKAKAKHVVRQRARSAVEASALQQPNSLSANSSANSRAYLEASKYSRWVKVEGVIMCMME